MKTTSFPAHFAPATGRSATPLAWARALFGEFVEWQGRASQRNQLRHLDDRQLSDMGLTHADVQREISKPFCRP